MKQNLTEKKVTCGLAIVEACSSGMPPAGPSS